MMPVVHIGPLSIQTVPLILLISLWIGLNQIEKHASKYNAQANLITNLVLFSLAAGIFGARFAYVLSYRDAFTGNIIGIFTFSPDTLDISSGLLFGFITGLIYINKKHMNLWETLDGLTPSLAVMMIGFGLANLASGDAYGIPTTVPWAIELWGENRHPTQVYQVVLACIAAWIIWPIRTHPLRWKKITYQSGMAFLLFVSVNSLGIILFAAFLGNSTPNLSGIRPIQLIAWITLAASLYFLDNKQVED
jgi:phosphatidylglycerol---prolipoprotein diacylglyceryl transferase